MKESYALDRYKTLVESIGRVGLHYLFPSDFEYYVCSLELTILSERTETTTDFFVFPVTPEQISYASPKIINIRKTIGGVTITKSSSFVPREANISGNFGRRFKFIIGERESEGNSFSFNFPFEIRTPEFDAGIKTGYGATKILEYFHEKSGSLSKEGNPYRLYFYNPALGHSWIVESLSLRLHQSKDINMMWAYDLTLKIVSPIYIRSYPDKSLIKTLSYDLVRKGLDTTFDVLTSALRK